MSEETTYKIKGRWVPGESGNPRGRPKNPFPKTLTKMDLRARIKRLFLSTQEDIQAVLANKESEWIDVCIASILAKIAKNGDANRLEVILTRLHGRTKEVIEVSGSVSHVAAIDLSKIPTEKLVMIEEVLNAATIQTAQPSDTGDTGGVGTQIPIEVLPDPES